MPFEKKKTKALEKPDESGSSEQLEPDNSANFPTLGKKELENVAASKLYNCPQKDKCSEIIVSNYEADLIKSGKTIESVEISKGTGYKINSVKYKAIDFVNRCMTCNKQFSSVDDKPDYSENSYDPTEEMQNDILVSEIYSLLPEDDQKLLSLKYFEGNTSDEIAGILGIKPEAARTRLKRLLAKINELLAKRNK